MGPTLRQRFPGSGELAVDAVFVARELALLAVTTVLQFQKDFLMTPSDYGRTARAATGLNFNKENPCLSIIT